jgi:DNA modification methylase
MIEILNSKQIPLSKLTANNGQIEGIPKNPRFIKNERYQKLVKSIQDNPEFLGARELIVHEHNNKFVVLCGNMRYRAAKELGFEMIPAKVIPDDYTTEQIKAIIIKDNISFGDDDFDALANEWDATELEEWGFEFPDLGEDFEPEILEAQEDDYEMPEQMQVDVVLGDLIEIGEHRLLCGDSTDSDQVKKLMNGQKADISFTSPPYNTKENAKLSPHQSNGTKYNSYSDDLEDDEYLKLLTDFTNNSLLFSDYSFVNIQSLSGNKTALIDFLYNMKTVYADTIIWQKQNAQPAMAENVLNSQFEYIHIFSHKANRAIGVKKFRGTLSNVLEISKQTKNEIKEHNATFPIDLASYFVSNFSEKSVIDLFLGSGTTMVASHQLKRKCYGMELDPKYCQVIIDRMRKLDPTLIIKINGQIYNK